MTQFDVFENPIPRARRAYPFVIVLQADLAEPGRDRIVAPLAPRQRLSGGIGRLTPHVEVGGSAYVILIPSMTTVLADELRASRGQLVRYRAEIVAALDYLFLGV